MGKKTSKGFFFVLISFVLMLYIFLYLGAWLNAMEISEKTSSEKFTSASLENIISQLNEERFNSFFDIAGYYAMFKINNHSSYIPMKYDSSDDLRYLKDAFFGCIYGGNSSDFDGTKLEYSQRELETYTFSAWLENLNFTLSQAGMEITAFGVSAQNFTQMDPVTFNASMDVSIFVRDRLSTISVNRTFRLSQQFNVSGMPDPMIKREYMEIDASSNVERQLFYRNITMASLAPRSIINGTQGQGFFYGPMVLATDVTATYPVTTKRHEYILVGTYSEIQSAISDNDEFGAYIITNSVASVSCPTNESSTFNEINYVSGCTVTVDSSTVTARPFAVIPSFDISAFRGPDSERRALIIAQESAGDVASNPLNKLFQVSAYDIEDLRDATVCTYFILSSRAPSYPQRLADALGLGLSNVTFGIETFLVGQWAGGIELPDYDQYSRVDSEFFRKVDGIKIRGMPGCKSPEMCSSAVASGTPLGHFRMSSNSIDPAYYDIEEIACDDGRAGCD